MMSWIVICYFCGFDTHLEYRYLNDKVLIGTYGQETIFHSDKKERELQSQIDSLVDM